MKKVLLLSNLSFSMIGAGQIWLVQLSSYPLWTHVGPAQFRDYHIAWWHSIQGPIFIPAGLAILCTIGLLRHRSVSRRALWVSIVLICLIYGLTFVWWAPLMALIGANPGEWAATLRWAPQLQGLQGRTQEQLYHLLIETHWLRLALVTAYAAVIFWVALRDPEMGRGPGSSRT